MKSRIKEQGSAPHIVIIVVLVVAVLGLLGFVFWQNFVNKPQADQNTVGSSDQTNGEKTFTSQKHGITFSYPNNWTVDESVSSSSSETWYSSQVKVLNESGELVARLGTGGQFGGSCDPDAAENKTTIFTTLSDSVTIPGVTDTTTHFTYIAVARDDGTYGVAYGLSNRAYTLGEAPSACVSMNINYTFVNQVADDNPIGNIMFGAWYESDQSSTTSSMSKSASFDSLDEAKAYSGSAEFKDIAKMIKSLKIEE